MVLVIPFVKIYTKGINDANYIRNSFAIIIILSEIIYSIRKPYNSLVLAAGHFKETRRGAWVEAISNIIISCILVFKYGIIGVAIGTLISVTIRTIEIIHYTSQNILNRSDLEAYKKVLPMIVESIIIIYIFNNFIRIDVQSFFELILYSVVVVIVATVIILLINLVINKDMIKKAFCKFTNIIHKGGNV